MRIYSDLTSNWFLRPINDPKVSPEGKIVVFNKMSHKNLIPFKNHEIFCKCEKVGSRVLGVTPMGLPPKTKTTETLKLQIRLLVE